MDVKNGIRDLKILHITLTAGVVLMAIVSLALHEFVPGGNSLAGTLPIQGLYVLGIVSLLLLFGAGYFFRNTMQAMEEGNPVEQRLARYRNTHIVRLSLVETSGLLVVIGYLLTANLQYLLLVVFPMMEFLRTFPREDKLADMLKLSYGEQRQLGVRSS